MNYEEKDIIQQCEIQLDKDVSQFYAQPFVNYQGYTTDSKKYYSEVIAQFVYEHLNEFKNGIHTIPRERNYRQESHDGFHDGSNLRQEEIIAMELFKQSNIEGPYDFIGNIIDYQTPLKAKRSDTAGKIDLLSFDGNITRVLELKKPDSDETMLRCVLEGYTYKKTVNEDKLKSDFNMPLETKFLASPLVFRNKEQYQEYFDVNRIWLHKLMNALDIKPFFLEKDENGLYTVWED